ncbi:uncharacterized protein LOC128346546 [Hemicordylus capensis]|uniref:uncharacterized protein LOC128346546 n=1 Tax=Hemicordylus capensis TaxID=884348 RepID=UPI0023041C8C|nr:uncharacterized protein LOC128346546 [Hemicordylus capensis]XP_053155942.1 uncharacterized protein LOC128346546 [Hemicordylus capensis]
MVAPVGAKTPEEPSGGSTTAAGSAAGDASEEQEGQGGEKSPVKKAKVLVLGHSFIFWALKWAQGTDPGTQLGLGRWATIEWLGRRGMRRVQLLPMLREYLEQNPALDILLFHFGGNDLVSQLGISLAWQNEQDLCVVLSWCPRAVILWSDITQRRVWQGACKQNKVDRARRGVNAAMVRFLAAKGGGCILHDDMLYSQPALYRGDGVHLSTSGMRFFLDDIRLGLATAILGLWGVGR